ncbi:MAG: HAMP domain-containing sensor histidine kinase [Acidimicrobiales bacterium]
MNAAPRSGLAVRISILAVAVAVITALFAGLIAVRLVNDADIAGARQTLSSLADDLANKVSRAPLESVTAIRKLRIDSAVITRTGRVVGTQPLARDALSPEQVQSVLAGSSISTVQNVDGGSTLVEARPFVDGVLVLVQPVSAAASLSAITARRMFFALLVSCAVAALLGVVVSRRIARPISRAAKAALSLAGGRRDVVVDPDGPREVAEVAFALNSLGENLSRAESRQRAFLLSVSHDLRTPLTAIRGYAESLADGVVGEDDIRRVGDILVGEAARLDRYVSDLLDLARLDAHELRFDIRNVDIAALVDAAASVWATRCQAEGVELLVEQPAEALWVPTDPGRLRQALDGLLENALRVVPAGAPIVLASRVEPDPWRRPTAVVEIRDGGPGFTDEDLAVAFERSALYERYRGIRKVGTGLGLAIVQRLVTRLGGSIEAAHAAEGGARFTIRLPISAPTSRAPCMRAHLEMDLMDR